MTLLDNFQRNPRAAPLLAELSYAYRLESYSEHCIALLPRDGTVRLLAHNLLELEQIARRHRPPRGRAAPSYERCTSDDTEATPTKHDNAGDTGSAANPKLADLEADNKRLRERGRAALRERDHWQARAEAAEAKVAEIRANGGAATQDKYGSLKKLLARELHPDRVQGDGLEKILREALFKRIWPMVERIDRGD